MMYDYGKCFLATGLGYEPPTSLANGRSSSFRLRRISRRWRIFSRRSPWRFLSYLLLPPSLPFRRDLAALSVLVIFVSHSASRHPPPAPAFRLSLSFSSLVVYPSLSSFRSVPFPPPRSQVAFTPSYLSSTCNLSFTLLCRPSVPFPPPRSQPSTCSFAVLPQTLKPSSNRDRTRAKLLSDKVSLHEQRGPASFDFKQTLPVQLLHSLCSVASSSSVGYA
jgi:hypothetical protein